MSQSPVQHQQLKTELCEKLKQATTAYQKTQNILDDNFARHFQNIGTSSINKESELKHLKQIVNQLVPDLQHLEDKINKLEVLAEQLDQ
eukprot:TRINITY_DN14734_c0_g2_i1.p2 TRINITY_DN14734_c0_g2~~TRINITY_DN14734_c0_g2_i1.p2  ORF type:complete len:102 (+),score=10.85 TRINITY_DN14734_c0_g2_i1:42-308(+)